MLNLFLAISGGKFWPSDCNTNAFLSTYSSVGCLLATQRQLGEKRLLPPQKYLLFVLLPQNFFKNAPKWTQKHPKIQRGGPEKSRISGFEGRWSRKKNLDFLGKNPGKNSPEFGFRGGGGGPELDFFPEIQIFFWAPPLETRKFWNFLAHPCRTKSRKSRFLFQPPPFELFFVLRTPPPKG